MAGPIRHPIDQVALERFISQNVPEIELPLEIKQFGYGQSNPTYQLSSNSPSEGGGGAARKKKRYVLRKKPPGKLLSAAAHKVEREYRVLRALASPATDVPVPRPYVLCEDASVVGTPFYIMQFLDGRIIEDPAIPGVSAEERTEMWKSAVTTLARLHQVDPTAVGLSGFGGAGSGGGFYARQIKTWKTICAAQAAVRDVKTGEAVGKLPHFDELMDYFSDETRQPRDRVSLVHGDYKIDNVVFHPTESRVVGILDWEMSTLGHPLSDLANLLLPHFTGAASSAATRGAHINAAFTASPDSPLRPPGLPQPPALVAWYGSVAGWDASAELEWATAFCALRLAAICQGIVARLARGQASSEKAVMHAVAMKPLAEFAWELVVARKRQDEEGKGGRARL